MRFLLNSILLGSLLLISTSGCQNASIRCQRETALLRAEILDLEDKYYALKSQHERVSVGNSGMITTSNVVGSGVIQGMPVVDSWPVEGQIVSGDVVYDDQMVGGAPMLTSPTLASPMMGEVYYDGQIVDGQVVDSQMIEGQTLPVDSPMITTPAENEPTPAIETGDPFELDIESPATSQPTLDDDQTLLLPGVPAQSDVPALEVGFDELELDLSDDVEVDRVEIVSSATRGRDLDGITGHDGIELMIRAINSDGESVSESGELTVTVSDNLVGEVGKWTFLPKELALFQSRDELGNLGTLLHLPWTDRIPVSRQVEVRVSMMIGQVQYVASQRLKIVPPTGQANSNAVIGWTASDGRWLSELRSNASASTAGPRDAGYPFQSRPISKAPETAVQRPQWKPVR